MKNKVTVLLFALTCTLAACGSNFEWFPDAPDTTKPTVSVTIGGQSVFTNNSSSSTTTVTATVSSFPAAVVFSANEPALVYYTFDGADPTTASTFVDIPVADGQVAGPSITANNTTLKFFGIDKADEKNRSTIQRILVQSSDTTAAVITATIGTVVVDSGTTTVAGLPAQVVFSADEAARVYYTTDGNEPSINSPDYRDITSALTPVNGPSITTAGTTLKYFSVDRSANSSAIQTTNVEVAAGNDTTAPEVGANVSGLLLRNDRPVTVASTQVTVEFIASEPVTIYYTTNNSDDLTKSSASVSIGSTLQADGPLITVSNTLLSFFGVDLANNQSSTVEGTIVLSP